MMTAFAIVLCPSHSFPNLMALVAASAFAPKASKVARTANRSRNMAILWLAKRHKNITAAGFGYDVCRLRGLHWPVTLTRRAKRVGLSQRERPMLPPAVTM